jgi:hypothetical protein
MLSPASVNQMSDSSLCAKMSTNSKKVFSFRSAFGVVSEVGQTVSVILLLAFFLHTRGSEADFRDGNVESGEDLTSDYHDLAVAVQGLGFLESGITDPLNHFSNTLLEFSALLRHKVCTSRCPYYTGPTSPLL